MTRQQLIERICETALLRGQFTLRSGKTSNYYLDKYRFETRPDILAAVGKLFAEHIDDSITRLAGPELGGVMLVAAVSLETNLPAVLIRNRKKDYGTANAIEGVLEKGDRVLIVEDVVTTGGQVIEAADAVVEAGAQVAKIVAVIDRQEGGAENIRGAGFGFDSLFTKGDLGVEG